MVGLVSPAQGGREGEAERGKSKSHEKDLEMRGDEVVSFILIVNTIEACSNLNYQVTYSRYFIEKKNKKK